MQENVEKRGNLANDDSLGTLIEKLYLQALVEKWGPPVSDEWRIAIPNELKIFHAQSYITSINAVIRDVLSLRASVYLEQVPAAVQLKNSASRQSPSIDSPPRTPSYHRAISISPTSSTASSPLPSSPASPLTVRTSGSLSLNDAPDTSSDSLTHKVTDGSFDHAPPVIHKPPPRDNSPDASSEFLTPSAKASNKRSFLVRHNEREIARAALSPVIGAKLYTLVKRQVEAPFYLFCEDTNEVLPNSSNVSTSSFPTRTTLKVKPGSYFSIRFHLPNQSNLSLFGEPCAFTSSLYEKVSAHTSFPSSAFSLTYQSTTVPNSSTTLESYFGSTQEPIEISVYSELQILVVFPDTSVVAFRAPDATPIATLYEKVAEKFSSPFFLSLDKMTTYPPTSSQQISSLLPSNESAGLKFHLIEAASSLLLEIVNSIDTNTSSQPIYLCSPANSIISALHEQISIIFTLPQTSFALATTDSSYHLSDSPFPLQNLPQNNQRITLYIIDTKELATVRAQIPSSAPLTFVQHKTSTLLSVLHKIATQLSQSPEYLYLAQHPPQLIPPSDYSLSLIQFVETERNINLHVIDTKSIIPIQASAADQVVLLGLPSETTTFQMWLVLAKYLPDMVGFVNGLRWTKFVRYDDPEAISSLSTSGQISVEALPTKQTVLVAITYDDAEEVSIFAHPDLVISDMFAALELEEGRQYKFVGPTEHELDDDDLKLRITEYVTNYNLKRASQPMVFRVTHYMGITVKYGAATYTLDTDPDTQITMEWLWTSLVLINRDISATNSVICSLTGIISLQKTNEKK